LTLATRGEDVGLGSGVGDGGSGVGDPSAVIDIDLAGAGVADLGPSNMTRINTPEATSRALPKMIPARNSTFRLSSNRFISDLLER
jgi:hypothetical protein